MEWFEVSFYPHPRFLTLQAANYGHRRIWALIALAIVREVLKISRYIEIHHLPPPALRPMAVAMVEVDSFCCSSMWNESKKELTESTKKPLLWTQAVRFDGKGRQRWFG